MALSPGTRLGPYEILSNLGVGGMGEVYKARDTRLDRTVAVKIIACDVAHRPELRQRFEREARAASALNHPNICTLHDFCHQDRVDFLVMEFLEGETLAARIRKGPLPIAELLQYAVQIASALSEAHRQGICHRDLKPANIMLTRSGIKLLDFGLAKLREPDRSADASAVPTVTGDLTQKGTILGTFQYMPPEQLEGRETDARGDIFSFGAVLYEMATARKAFQGSSHASMIAAIMSSDPPPIATVQPMLPPALEHVIRTCLAKKADDRWQSAHDVLVELKWITGGGSQAGVPQPVILQRKIRERVAWILAASGLALAVAMAATHFAERQSPVHPVRFLIPLPAKAALQPVDVPVISPDGRSVVFGATGTDGKWVLWLRSLDSLELKPLSGTESAYLPFWSPDSRHIGFHSFTDQKLKAIDLDGGPTRVICDLARRATLQNGGGTWNREGTILFRPGPGGGLHRVAAAGGQAVPWLELDQARKEISQAWPQFLPDGRRFLYFSVCADPSLTGMYMGSLDSRETRMVYRSAFPGRYAAPSFLVMAREQTLIAQAFDLRTLRVSSEASVIADGVGPLYPGGGAFSVSDNGILVHRGTLATAAQLGSYNREGRRLELVGSPGNYRQFTLSPDERRLAIEIPGPTRGGIWLLEISSGILSRAASGGDPVWSPDGRQLAFHSRGGLARKAIGARDELPILELKEPGYTKQWLKDGSILFLSQGGKIFYLLPAMENAAPQNSTERKPMPLLETDFDKDRPTISPDGRWVAYNSLESGRWEVYVAAFPGFTDKRQVSSAGGCQPHWRKDGKELFYLALDGKLMTVDVTTDGGIETGSPKLIFQTPIRVLSFLNQYSVTSDGRRFIIAEPVEDEKPITVILNWAAGLKNH